ncbi:endospore germination permease [Paenibacillus allorhizosphaerae]|uniref:Spore germination protein YndE n=1 Tax=Paenibacillus allorhizosphaerae TaxID=2849866 RepID=A0ABN7TU44_9BACL|nr:endospore germination permease [Paenibacillus allorhizosphaerae]CAG7655939.1 Spore germination protein YndE [Paenibacillus allorhizosphaerae]
MRENKISVRQFSVLIAFFTIGTTILIIPAGLAIEAKQDAWIASIVGVVAMLLVVLLYNSLGKRIPNVSLVQYNDILFGRWAGKIVSLLLVFFAFIGSSTLLFYVGNFMTTQVMPDTPIQFINMLFISIVVMGLRLGLETLARAAEIFFPWFVMLFLVLFLFLVPEIELPKMQPVFESGAKPILKAALSLVATASFTQIVMLMIIPVHVTNPDKARKAYYVSTLIGGAFIILVTFLCISVLGVDTTSRNVYPSYALTKKISIGHFVERIESLMAGLWFMSIYFKMTLYFYACTIGIAQMLKLKDYRPLCLPLGMIVVVFSLVVYPNVTYMAHWDSTVYIPYATSIGLLLPLLMLVISFFKEKKRGQAKFPR